MLSLLQPTVVTAVLYSQHLLTCTAWLSLWLCMQTVELSWEVQACLSDIMYEIDTSELQPPMPSPTATQLNNLKESKLPPTHGNEQHLQHDEAATSSSFKSPQAEMHTTDASHPLKHTQPQTETAGVPKVHEGSLKMLCVVGLLAALANMKAWSVAEEKTFELCLHWSHQHVTAWMDRQDQAASSQHTLHNYPVLEPHAAMGENLAARVPIF